MDNEQLDVFVSYSSKNKNIADAIVSDFESNGIKCWYAPRDIMPGEEWVTAITTALQKCKIQVLIYTDESNESRQVMNEVAVAFNAGKTIVPFRLTENRMNSEFEYYLTRVHWLDGISKSLQENISELRKYVQIILVGENQKAENHGSENAAGTNAVKSNDSGKETTVASNKTVKNKIKKKKVAIPVTIASVFGIVGVFALLLLVVIISIVLISTEGGSGLMKRGKESFYSRYQTEEDNDKAKELFERAAKKGKEDAYYYLGLLAERDLDYAGAKAYYETGVSEGSELSRIELGYLYEKGFGVYPDLKTAKSYYDTALQNGCVEANFYEGCFVIRGYYGKNADALTAMDYFDKALQGEEKGIIADTYLQMAAIYEVGYDGVEADNDKAISYYQKAMDTYPYYYGYCNYCIGDVYFNNDNEKDAEISYEKALGFYEYSGKQGCNASLVWAGYFYQYGISTEADGEYALELFKKACDNNYTLAMTDLGTLYEYGYGDFEVDYSEAYNWYKKAADLNDSNAMRHIGDMYFTSRYGATDGKPDDNMARYWYEQAINNGCISAYYSLGVMYEQGYGSDLDYNKAMEYFLKSAEYGDSDAMYEISKMYSNNYIVSEDNDNETKALEWLYRSAELGNKDALCGIGRKYEDIGDYENAKKWYLLAASKNSAGAMTSLGLLYYDGKFTGEPDYENAFNWFENASDAGGLLAMSMLGNMYLSGKEGVEQDYEKARVYFEKATYSGLDDASAYFSLGKIYFYGFGTDVDYSKAKVNLEKASDLGEGRASEFLGMMYYYGTGVAENHENAFYYLNLAVDLKAASAESYKILGYRYYQGDGVDMSYAKAKPYFEKAVEMGLVDDDVYACLGFIYYDESDYPNSALYFGKSASMNNSPDYMYDTGLAYYYAYDYDNSLLWLKKALDSGFEMREKACSMIEGMVAAGYIAEEDAFGYTE